MRSPTPPFHWRRLRIWFIAIAALLVLWAGANLLYVAVDAEIDQTAPAPVILVLGCKAYENGVPTPCIRARAAHAADLYLRGMAAHVIASGGPSQSGPAEAGVLAVLLEQDGVPETAVLQEDRSHNTIQNIYNTREILREHGWNDILLVTEPYHMKRAALIARDAGIGVRVSPAADSPDWQQPGVRIIKLITDAVKLGLYQVKALVGNYD